MSVRLSIGDSVWTSICNLQVHAPFEVCRISRTAMGNDAGMYRRDLQGGGVMASGLIAKGRGALK